MFVVLVDFVTVVAFAYLTVGINYDIAIALQETVYDQSALVMYRVEFFVLHVLVSSAVEHILAGIDWMINVKVLILLIVEKMILDHDYVFVDHRLVSCNYTAAPVNGHTYMHVHYSMYIHSYVHIYVYYSKTSQ